MREIYERSERVVIYLGESADGSALLPDLGRRILFAGLKFGLYAGSGRGLSHEAIVPRGSYELLGLPSADSNLWRVFRAFLRRPWFRRVWIIQEAVVARNAGILCADWKMEMDMFRNMTEIALIGDMLILGSEDRRNLDNSMAGGLLHFMFILGAGKAELWRMKLIDLLHRGRIANATDPRGYAFALLGLSIESEEPELKPDYSENIYPNMSPLHFLLRGGSKGLPSWIPDWNNKNIAQPRLCPEPLVKTQKQHAFSAASSFQPSIYLDPCSSDILIVKGVRFDAIESIGTVQTAHSAVSRTDLIANAVPKVKDLLSSKYGEREGAWQTIRDMRLIADCTLEIRRMLRERGVYPTTEDHDTVTWRTMVYNLGNRTSSAASPEYAQFYRAFNISMKGIDWSWEAPSHTRSELQNTDKAVYEGRVFVQGAQEFCASRRRCRSCRGYIGQVPLNARIGDIIFIPLGSALPFILRHKGDTYEFIGECYIHGIMSGEAFISDDVQMEDILLA